MTLASVLGIGYGWAAYALAGIHWMYGTVAALLATLGGLLPDLDSASGVEMRGFTGILGVLSALIVWHKMGRVEPPPAFEFHLWAVIFAYIIVRYGLKRIATKIAVHRGISHSFPTCAVWGALVYLHYPTESHALKLTMAVSVMIGFFSHLFLDEYCSVDLRGARVNKAFGTAMKFWAPSIWTTIGMYGLLSYLTWRILQVWPEDPYSFDPPAPPVVPNLPDRVQDLLKRYDLEPRRP